MHWDISINGASIKEISNEITVNFYCPTLQNHQRFFTDGNGLKMVKRNLNSRESYPEFKTPQKISSNFFPIYSAIAIADLSSNLQMTVMTDRTMGGSSLVSGRIELHAHRRINGDD